MYNSIMYLNNEVNQSILISKYNINYYLDRIEMKKSYLLVYLKSSLVENAAAAYFFLLFLGYGSKIKILNKNKRFYRRQNAFKKTVNNLEYLLKVNLTKKQLFEFLEFLYVNSIFDNFKLYNILIDKGVIIIYINFKSLPYLSKMFLKLNEYFFDLVSYINLCLIINTTNTYNEFIKINNLKLLKIK